MPNDLQLWCEDCQVGYEGDCVQHGPLTRVRDADVDSRARRSIPGILQLRDQQDFTGVYARKKLDKRLQFGPLLAVKVLEGTDKAREAAQQISSKGGLVLWISETSGEKFLLDTRHEERTNWMCFVRAAQHRAQQNVVAIQYRGQIFFVTIKEIPAECELRVWYSKDYAERMGTSLLCEERQSWQFRTRERFRCAGCSVVFSSSSSLSNHRCSAEGGNGAAKLLAPTTSSVAGTSSDISLLSSLPSTSGFAAAVVTTAALLSKFAGIPGRGSIHHRAGRRSRGQGRLGSGKGKVPRKSSGSVSIVVSTASVPSVPSETVTSVGPSASQVSCVQGVLPSEVSESTISGEGDSSKRKFVKEESESESSSKSVRTYDEISPRRLGSKGGTAKRLKGSFVKGRTASKLPPRSFDEASIVVEEVGGVRRAERTVETQHEELTRESIVSEIRAQVLQSVHSLSSSEDSGSLVLPGRESEIVDPVSSVFSIEELEGVEPPAVEGALAVEVTCLLSSEASVEAVEASLGEPQVLTPFVEPAGLLEEQLSAGVTSEVPSSAAEEAELQERAREACGVCGEVGPHSCTSRVFSCPSCNKSFSSRFKLSRHQLIHGSERHYRCHICERSFHRKDHLKNHLQIHKPTKQFKCEREDCGKEYNSYMSYRKHCAFHSAEEGDLQCKFCSKMFVNKNDLIYHLKVHVGTRTVKNPSEKKFQCDQCDRRFFTRKDVKRHLVVHTGTRDFCCSLCPQKFGRKDHLVRHIKKSHGVTDLTRLETLADPLAVPGPSGIASASSVPPLSPGLSSVSTSSGETSGLPAYMLPSSPTPHQSMPSPEPSSSQDPGSSLPSYQEVGTPSFSGFIGDPSADMRILVGDPIKEEHDLTASVAGLGPDLSNILGLYLPSSEGINMTSIMDTSSTTSSIVTTHLQEVSTLPPPSYSASHFQPMSPLPPNPFSSQPTSPTTTEEMERLLPTPTDTSTTTTTTTSTTSSSTTFLPGFDQAFP